MPTSHNISFLHKKLFMCKFRLFLTNLLCQKNNYMHVKRINEVNNHQKLVIFKGKT